MFNYYIVHLETKEKKKKYFRDLTISFGTSFAS